MSFVFHIRFLFGWLTLVSEKELTQGNGFWTTLGRVRGASAPGGLAPRTSQGTDQPEGAAASPGNRGVRKRGAAPTDTSPHSLSPES